MSSKDMEAKLLKALEGALEWIDAVPDEVASSLPAMPGFDRDDVDSLVAESRNQSLLKPTEVPA